MNSAEQGIDNNQQVCDTWESHSFVTTTNQTVTTFTCEALQPLDNVPAAVRFAAFGFFCVYLFNQSVEIQNFRSFKDLFEVRGMVLCCSK